MATLIRNDHTTIRRGYWQRGRGEAGLVVRGLLACGVVALVLYVALDAAAALRYDGYSYRDQTISELSAIDAPTRSFWLPFAYVYEALVFALVAGVFAVARGKRSLQVIGWAILIYAVLGLAWPFAPMHQREVLAAGGSTWSDTLHLVLAGITSAAFFAMIIAGVIGFRGGFRNYSIATMILLAVFGSLVSLGAGAVADNGSTPWIGVFERINVVGAMLWMAVLAVVLMRRLGEFDGAGSSAAGRTSSASTHRHDRPQLHRAPVE